MTAYTPAQLRALEWLPGDGSWDTGALRDRGHIDQRNVSAAKSLRSAYPKFVDRKSWRFRLTPAGIAERARLVAEGLIKC